MRYAMTSLLVHFRSTLEFFENRDRAMLKYHPDTFPHWRRGEKHFTLIDTENRKVIRFEPNRFIVRAEGHDSLDLFSDCVKISLNILKDYFNVKDIFFIQLESIQLEKQKSLFKARYNFANKFLNENSFGILPKDQETDYQLALERTEDVDSEFSPVKSQLSKRIMTLTRSIIIGPVIANEVKNKFLEFKENSEHEQYKTKAIVPDFAHLIGVKLSLVPKKKIKVLFNETIDKFYPWAIEQANAIWDKIFGGQQW